MVDYSQLLRLATLRVRKRAFFKHMRIVAIPALIKNKLELTEQQYRTMGHASVLKLVLHSSE